MIFKWSNITKATGVSVVGPVACWTAGKGAGLVEHLAGTTPSDDLVVFFRSAQNSWQVVNLTAKTGHKIMGPVCSWQTQNGPNTVEHLAGMGPNGDLIAFWWSPQHDWQSVNVTQTTGQKIAGPVAAWQTRNGPFNVEHLAGMAPGGDLVGFWWSPQHDWQAVNISQKTGLKIASTVTAWQTPNGPFNVEHLAGISPTHDLITFWWSPQHDWQAVNISAKTGQKIASAVTSWQTPNGPQNVEHLAGMGPGGDLVTFWWSPAHDWQSLNVSEKTGHQIAGPVASWQTSEHGYLFEYLAGSGKNDELLVFWWSPTSDWQCIDNTAVMRQTLAGSPGSWKTIENGGDIDHLAGVNRDGHLLAFWHSTEWDYPWAILVAGLKNQPGNSAADPATPFSLFDSFFTASGVATNNAVKYFAQMSHGNADLSKSRVFSVAIDVPSSDVVAPNPMPVGWSPKYDEGQTLELVRKAAIKSGIDLKAFYADVLTSTIAAFPTHGGVEYSNVLNAQRGFAYGDHRYVALNGTQSFGHEMGHGFGFDHSRADDPNVNVVFCQRDTLDYRDPWDKMSYACDFSDNDPDYTLRGPGFNAFNMRARHWLDEGRVWKNASTTFDETIELRPLHRWDLPGNLAAEVPPNDKSGHGKFLVEFRLKDEWDSAFPRSAVLVHRLDNNQSYIMSGRDGTLDLVAGHGCAPWVDSKHFPSVDVVDIDEAKMIATVRLVYDVVP